MICRRALLLVLLTVSACAQQQGSARAAGGFQISGTVVNALTGQPLPRVEVTIAPVVSRVPLHTITGNDGHFAFSGLATGKYSLNARGRGFPDQAYEEHEPFSTAIAAGPGLESESLVFRIKPGVRISGTVTDEASEPVADAQIFLFKSGLLEGTQGTHMKSESRSDDRGHYSFGYLPEGTYFVVVTATPWYMHQTGVGFVPQGVGAAQSAARQAPSESGLEPAYPITYYPGVTDQQEATPIRTHAGDRVTADVQLTAVPGYRVTVRYPEGKHADFVEVSQRVFDLSLPVSGSSAGGGVSTSDEIPAGHYIVRLRTAAEPNTGRELEMDIAGDTDLDAAALQTPEVTIAGTIQAVGGATLPQRMFIVFANRHTREEFAGQVSSKGEFELHHGVSSPGDYEIELGNPRGLMVYSMSATGAKVSGRTIHLAGSASVYLNVVVSKGAGQVDGIVLREKKPAAAAMVVLVPKDLQNNLALVRRDQSDSDGTFTLPRVVPGNYTVVAIQDGWNLEWAEPNVIKPYLAHGTPVVIDHTGDYHVTVQVQ